MANVRFLRGTSQNFAAIATKDENTFYYLTDTKKLYLGEIPINSTEDLEAVGSLDDLKTDVKDNVVNAINEIFDKVAASKEDYKVTIEKDEAGLIYKVRQGKPITDDTESNVIGTINIPADIIVKDASVVENPEGQPEGKYIALVTNTESGEKTVYLNLNDLVKPYTALENATKVQLFINEDNVISATILEGAITATELANGSITKNKLAQDVLDLMGGALEWETF